MGKRSSLKISIGLWICMCIYIYTYMCLSHHLLWDLMFVDRTYFGLLGATGI